MQPFASLHLSFTTASKADDHEDTALSAVVL